MSESLAQTLASCRVVDLSKKVTPGKADGPLGLGSRRYELRRFTFPPGELMHEVWMETHISTHIESPAHFMEPRHGRTGKDVSELPLTCYFGEAVLVDLSAAPPNHEVLPEEIISAGARSGDIVIFGKSRQEGAARPFLGERAARALAGLPAKMIGVDDTVYPEDPRVLMKDLDKYFIHDFLLSKDIPLIEGLMNLEALDRARFVFFGIPAAMGGCDSFPIRAVALLEP